MDCSELTWLVLPLVPFAPQSCRFGAFWCLRQQPFVSRAKKYAPGLMNTPLPRRWEQTCHLGGTAVTIGFSAAADFFFGLFFSAVLLASVRTGAPCMLFLLK
jgi:hypothetical protein